MPSLSNRKTTLASIEDPDVRAVFDAYPTRTQSKLLQLRDLIFEVAARTEGVGKLQETLKWGQPSYLTPFRQSGTTIRIDQIPDGSGDYAMYFHCQTTLVDSFREMYGHVLTCQGNRAIIFKHNEELPAELKLCIEMALTYHRQKKNTKTHG